MSQAPKLKYCVYNEWSDSRCETYTPVLNPSTGQIIAQAPTCTPAEVENAVQAAREAFPAWSRTPVAVRTQVIFRFRELVNAHFEELATPAGHGNGQEPGRGPGATCSRWWRPARWPSACPWRSRATA